MDDPVSVEFSQQLTLIQRKLYSYILTLVPNRAEAEDIAAQVTVDYEVLPTVLTWRDAMEADAAVLPNGRILVSPEASSSMAETLHRQIKMYREMISDETGKPATGHEAHRRYARRRESPYWR